MISSKRNTGNTRSYRDNDEGSSSEEEDLDNSEEYEEESNSKTKEKVTKFIEEKKVDYLDDLATSSSPDKENEENNAVSSDVEVKKKKKKKEKSKIDEKKRRRRSSARFLSLSGRNGGGLLQDDDNNDKAKEHDQEKLSQMYKKALRMNAENRINVGNTWSLGLIDHLDKFLADDDNDDNNDMLSRMKSRTKKSSITLNNNQVNESKEKRINFTKASVTLDASVKIYSYRVDDTHLSSYKVLANLNRTDNGKSTHDDNAPTTTKTRNNRRNSHGRGDVDTLESNIDNINVNKLEQEYDVDPLFHKMSKTFDEGGAKGLLLVNLGVSSNGCNILFDNSAYQEDDEQQIVKKEQQDDSNIEEDKPAEIQSESISEGDIVDAPMENNETLEGEETNEEKSMREEETVKQEETAKQEEDDAKQQDDDQQMLTTPTSLIPPDFDTSPFISKLKDLLNGQHIATLPLVPQLCTLREDLISLEKEGYAADKLTPQKSKRRYATDPEEEEEAERSIHQDALERSRISACNLTYDASIMDFSGWGGNDFGGNDYDDNHHDDDDIHNEDSQVFSGLDFSILDSNNEFSSSSNADNNKNEELVDNMACKQQKSTGRMLDLICKSNLIGVETDYQFFNNALLQKMSSGNFWAGSNHWKRSKRATADIEKKKETEQEQTKEKVKRKKSNKVRTYVDLSSNSNPASTLESLFDQSLNSSKKGKGKSTKKVELQFSDKTLSTQLENDYILPIDAGIAIEQMGQLFLRKATITSADETKKSNGKQVGFRDDLNDTMIYGGDEHNDNDDYGGGGDDYDDGSPASGFTLNQSCDGEGDQFGDYENYQSQTADGVRKVNKIEINFATVSKKVDVKRLKRDLWSELEVSTGMKENNDDVESVKDNNDDDTQDPTQDGDTNASASMEDSCKDGNSNDDDDNSKKPDVISFKDTVDKIDASQSQNGVTLPFYFICLLHLANEKGLRLDSPNLHDNYFC